MSNVERSAPTGPAEIAPNCWMVGHRNPTALLQCNTYLRTYPTPNGKLNLTIDPGSRFDYPEVQANIEQVIGDLRAVSTCSLNHQDPDVVGNTPAFCAANPAMNLLVTEDTWRLVRHLDFHPGHVEFASAARNSRTLGGRLRLVPTPFCHFRGAMAFYDPEIKTLFSGDLFGGINQLGRVHLYAEDEDWIGIAQFHQIYMPSREILRYAVRQIEALNPAVEIIAPQHGHVIVGEQVPKFLERMRELLVGYDLLIEEFDDQFLTAYQEVIRQLVGWVGDIIGHDEVFSRLKRPDTDDLNQQLSIIGRDVTLVKEGYSALAKVFERLARGEASEYANTLRSLILALCSERSLPIPPIGTGIEEEMGE